ESPFFFFPTKIPESQDIPVFNLHLTRLQRIQQLSTRRKFLRRLDSSPFITENQINKIMASGGLVSSSSGTMGRSLVLIMLAVMAFSRCIICMATAVEERSLLETAEFTLDSVRQSLTGQEDTIVYRLIERAKFPLNSRLYDQKYELVPGSPGTLIQFLFKQTEIVQAKAGRYLNPEETPFFPENLPPSVIQDRTYPVFLHLPAASVNVNSIIWDVYFNKFLPLLVKPGDDGNYAATSASDIELLQVTEDWMCLQQHK
ncbi:unnamed protein product, partial [Linum tenue]